MLSVFREGVIILRDMIQSAILLRVTKLNVVLLYVAMLNVMAHFKWNEEIVTLKIDLWEHLKKHFLRKLIIG
jgi:hypothetical protein